MYMYFVVTQFWHLKMAQVKVTRYYSRRKRVDDAQPSKRRKLLHVCVPSEGETDSSSTAELSDLKAGLQAFTKQLLPRVDRAVLLQDTISQCTITSSAETTTQRSKTTRKTRASTAKKTPKKGPLDKHLERLSKSLSKTPDFQSQFDSIPVAEIVHRSPPSTPTKRHQQCDEAPSRKKRSRLGSADDVLETDESSGTMVAPLSTCSRSRRKAHFVAVGEQQARHGGRSAKKSLEATLKQFTITEVTEKSTLGNDNVSNKQTTRPQELAKTTKREPSISESPRAAKAVVLHDPGSLQKFIQGKTQSLATSNPEGSKTKLTATEMRERLTKSYKLSELQSRLAKVKEFAEQAKSHQKAAKELGNASSSSNPKAPAASTIKTEEPAMPAYQKYHALTKSAPSTLTLPFKYKLLEEMFRNTDTVVSMLHNRSETCSFPKLKPAVQELCRKTFEMSNLGQMKTVYPTAYFLKQQKIPRRGLNQGENFGYELLVEANCGSGVGTSAGQESSESGKQSSEVNAKSINAAVSKLVSKFTPSMLIARRSIFHSNLVDIVKEHHSEFLSKLNRPLSVPSDKLTRWHPKFPLDQTPDVEPSVLPKPPAVTTYSTAKDVLDKARFMMNPRIAKALEIVAKNSALLKAEKEKPKADDKMNVKPKPKDNKNERAVSGVNQSLLDRIRAKEAHYLAAEMTRNPEEQERIAMLERLPELCRILRVFFVAEKKAALPLEVVVQKLTDSYPSILSKAQVEKHVALMVETLPDWLSQVKVRKDHYLKINKTREMGQVNERVKQLLRESKQVKG